MCGREETKASLSDKTLNLPDVNEILSINAPKPSRKQNDYFRRLRYLSATE